MDIAALLGVDYYEFSEARASNSNELVLMDCSTHFSSLFHYKPNDLKIVLLVTKSVFNDGSMCIRNRSNTRFNAIGFDVFAHEYISAFHYQQCTLGHKERMYI